MINEVYGYFPESRIKLNNLTMALQVTTELCFNISFDKRKCVRIHKIYTYIPKSLKILKGESVNRRTDNTMAKRKKEKQ
jgi:hypothetical protein